MPTTPPHQEFAAGTHLHQRNRLEQEHVTLERAKIDATANVKRGDVPDVVHERRQGKKCLVVARHVPQRPHEAQVQDVALAEVHFDAVEEVCVERHVPRQEMLHGTGRLDGLQKQRTERAVVLHVEPMHEPTQGGQHARVHAVMQLERDAELVRVGAFRLVLGDVMHLAVEVERQHVARARVHVQVGQREVRGDHHVAVHAHDAPVHGHERNETPRAVHVAGVKNVVRVVPLALAHGPRHVHLVHALHHVHAVVGGAEQRPEHPVHFGRVGAPVKGGPRARRQVRVPPVGGLVLRRIQRHGPRPDTRQVVPPGPRLGFFAVLREVAPQHPVEVRRAREKTKAVLAVQAVTAQRKHDQRRQQPTPGVQLLHLQGDGGRQHVLDPRRERKRHERQRHVHAQRQQVVTVLQNVPQPTC